MQVTMQQTTDKSHRLAKRLLAVLLCLALVLALPLGACAPKQDANNDAAASGSGTEFNIPTDLAFDDFAELLFVYEVSLDTMTLNQMLEDPSALGISASAPTLGDYTFAAYQQDDRYYQEYLGILSSYKFDDLSSNQQIIYQQIEQALKVTLDSEQYYYYAEPLRPSMGVQANLPISFLEFNFRSKADIDTYIDLLNDVPRYFDQLLAHEQEKQKLDLLMPLEAMQDTIAETLTYAGDAQSHILVSSFNSLLAGNTEPFASLTVDERQSYQASNLAAVSDSVIPAYQKLNAELTKISKSCKTGTSITSYKQGSDYYQIQMQVAGFAQTPTEAAQTLDSVLLDYYDIIVDSSVSLDQSQAAIQTALQSVPDDPEGILKYLQEHYTQEFSPLANTQYQVKPAPKETPNDFALAFYIIPPVDNGQQNTIYYYPDNISEKSDFYTTLAHEGIPGHMYQTNAFAEEQPGNIQKLLMSTAYMEGWAMYAQATSLDFLDISAESADVAVAFEQFMYGIQARIDIGVNYEGWDVKALENYLAQWSMEAGAEELYQTAVKQPMAYLPYGLGVVEFDQLELRAKKSLGNSYDPVRFHQQLIQAGGVPFSILEARIESWLTKNTSGQKA